MNLAYDSHLVYEINRSNSAMYKFSNILYITQMGIFTNLDVFMTIALRPT